MAITTVTALCLSVVLAFTMTAPALAQTPDAPYLSDQSDTDMQAQSDTDSGSGVQLVDPESSRKVDLITRVLIGIAIAMTVLLLLYVVHTSPRQRLRVARRRSRQLADIAALSSNATTDSEQPPKAMLGERPGAVSRGGAVAKSAAVGGGGVPRSSAAVKATGGGARPGVVPRGGAVAKSAAVGGGGVPRSSAAVKATRGGERSGAVPRGSVVAAKVHTEDAHTEAGN